MVINGSTIITSMLFNKHEMINWIWWGSSNLVDVNGASQKIFKLDFLKFSDDNFKV